CLGGDVIGKHLQNHLCSRRRGRLLSFWGVVGVVINLAHICCAGLHYWLFGRRQRGKTQQRGWCVGDRQKGRNVCHYCSSPPSRHCSRRRSSFPGCRDFLFSCE